jgi:hypothetical protein
LIALLMNAIVVYKWALQFTSCSSDLQRGAARSVRDAVGNDGAMTSKSGPSCARSNVARHI